jgi:hypothetical protein
MKKINMKISSIAIVFACLLAQKNVSAQSSAAGFTDVKGVNFLNAGIGLGSYGLYGTGGLPLTASFEHGFTDKISAGINIGYIQRKYINDWKYSYLIFGARGSYHFNELLNVAEPKLDLYGGAGLIYRHWKFKYTSDGTYHDYKSSGGSVDFALHAGGRYLFNEHIGAYAEVGYGISPLQLGVTFKF